MKMKIIVVLTIFLTACASSNKANIASEDNRDVFILSTLVQDHLRQTDGQGFNLDSLIKADTLNRISKNFEKIELELRAAFIVVHFKFSGSRDVKKIELSNKEREIASQCRWTVKELNNEYDGGIRFDYGERFYRTSKIIISTRENK
jgi:hypothetical protein